MCDIENCENDFTDGIPNPFDVRSDKVEVSSLDDIFEQSIGSSCGELEQLNNVHIDLNSTNESIFSVDMTRNGEKKSPVRNGVRIEEKEHSNAFQVLMTRTKPPKPFATKQLSVDEGISLAENCIESKSKTKQNENRLVIPIEKRSCAKRKLTDKDEEHGDDRVKTGERLGSRTRVFKKTKSTDCFESSPSESNRKPFVNGLHNYFNKITPEEREKERLLSSMAVKADIHEPSSVARAQYFVSRSNSDGLQSKRRQIFSAIDDVHYLRSVSDPLREVMKTDQMSEQQSQPRHKKPKWSLRINFQSHGEESSVDDGGLSDGQTTQSESWARSRQKSMKKVVRSRKTSTERKEEEQPDDVINLDIENIDTHTANPSFVLNNEMNDDLENCDRNLGNNGSDTSIEIIETKKSSNDKLAPLFIKRLRPDPKVTAARRSFLHSRSPEDEKKTQRKVLPPTTPILPFPLVSHVNQLDMETINDTMCHNIRFQVKKPSVYIPSFDSGDLENVNKSSDIPRETSTTTTKALKVSIEAALQEVEQRCSDAQEMWKTISSIMNKEGPRLTPKKRGPKRKSIDKKTNQIDYKNSVYIDTWTQKYRPLSVKEVVGNEEAATRLRNWLKTWKLSTSKDDYSSGEEFHCSDNSSNESSQNNQVAVLIGPHGTGKTASVYASAEELGYTVLEVNASSRRSGRKILKELEEATKSHRVKKTDLKAPTQPKLSNKQNTLENSLILVEDVDLIFEEDDGFISAIHQLSSNTKRPIVMTCRDSCSHLSRMAPQQLQIYFRKISGVRATSLIELIALAETGAPIPRSCSEKLIVTGDLRKALLKLQYFLLSGTLHAAELTCSFRETLWQNTRNYLYKPNVRATKKRSIERNVRENPLKTEKTSLASLADDLATVSLVSSLVDVDDPLLNISRMKFEPTVSLEENVDLYSHKSVRSYEIGEWLTCQLMHKYTKKHDDIDLSTLSDLTRKKQSNMSVNRALSQATIHTLDTRIVSTDYLPAVRTICRAEEKKMRNNVKRGNRFFHYLQNLRMPSASIKPHILTAACRAMQDSSELSS